MRARHFALQQGFTIIELMVAVAIGLITVLIMNQALFFSEGYRRSATSGGDVQTSGSLAMFMLQRDLRNAGYGLLAGESDGSLIPITPLSICAPPNKTRLLIGGPTTGSTVELGSANKPGFVHFAIYPPGSTVHDAIYPAASASASDYSSDIIQVMYAGSSASVSTAVHAAEVNLGAGPPALRLKTSRFGFHKGDLILVASTSPASVDGAAYNQPICMINEVTALPGSLQVGDPAGNALDLLRNETGTYCSDYLAPNPVASCPPTVNPSMNPHIAAANQPLFNIALGPADLSTRVYNFGPKAEVADTPSIPLTRFVARFYRIHSQRLESCDFLASDCTSATAVWVPIADNIVSMRAAYGVDDGSNGGTAKDGVVDRWTQDQPNPPTTSWSWPQVLSARISIVARSRNFEKSATTTTESPSWSGSEQTEIDGALVTNPLHDSSWAGDYAHNIKTLADWGHYRYRVFESTIPFRNLIWK